VLQDRLIHTGPELKTTNIIKLVLMQDSRVAELVPVQRHPAHQVPHLVRVAAVVRHHHQGDQVVLTVPVVPAVAPAAHRVVAAVVPATIAAATGIQVVVVPLQRSDPSIFFVKTTIQFYAYH
jgi:hypothetical protein